MTTESRAAFARRLGWHRSSVTRAVDDGRVVLDGDRVNVEESLRRIEALAHPAPHHQAHVRQLEEQRAAKAGGEGERSATGAAGQGDPASGDSKAMEGLEAANLRLKRAEADKREEEAKMARQQRQILEGEYIHVDAVRFALKDHSAQIMGLHENVADRLTPLIDPLQSYEEKHAAISEFMADMQREIHDSSDRSKRMLGQNR